MWPELPWHGESHAQNASADQPVKRAWRALWRPKPGRKCGTREICGPVSARTTVSSCVRPLQCTGAHLKNWDLLPLRPRGPSATEGRQLGWKCEARIAIALWLHSGEGEMRINEILMISRGRKVMLTPLCGSATRGRATGARAWALQAIRATEPWSSLSELQSDSALPSCAKVIRRRGQRVADKRASFTPLVLPPISAACNCPSPAAPTQALAGQNCNLRA